MTVSSATVYPILHSFGGCLGAEITGLDVSRKVDRDIVAFVRQAPQDQHVICIRQQSLSEAQQSAFSEMFGPLETFSEKDKTKSKSTVYHVANVSTGGVHLSPLGHQVIFQKVNARWHPFRQVRRVK